MNNLMNNIKNAITSSIEELINNISEKYNIDVNELSELWNNNSSNLKISSVKTKTIKKDKSVSSSSVSSTDDNKCPYIFSRGEKQGEICGVKSKKDCEYCSKHQKYEGVGQPVEKKKTPKAKNTIAEKSLPKKKTPVKKSVELEKTFKLNKDINKYWNFSTQLVIKSKDERVVIGSYRDDELKKLTDDDIILCEKYGFEYQKDKDPIEKSDESEEDVDVESEDAKPQPKTQPKTQSKIQTQPKTQSKIQTKQQENKSISGAIEETNIKAKDIENILKELHNDDGDDTDFEEHIEEEEDD